MPAVEQVTELRIQFARIEEKCDSIIQRLDTLNGSVAHLQETANRHDADLIRLTTEKNMLGKLAKPAMLLLAAGLGALLGMQAHVPAFLDFLK